MPSTRPAFSNAPPRRRLAANVVAATGNMPASLFIPFCRPHRQTRYCTEAAINLMLVLGVLAASVMTVVT